MWQPDTQGIIPIPIEEIADFKLGLNIVPVSDMKRRTGIDGCISKDLSAIYVDSWQYLNHEFRSRFTIAHELGHFWMHGDYIKGLDLKNVDNWKAIVMKSKNTWNSMEYQAYMFAGFVLIPTLTLEQEIGELAPGYELSSSIDELQELEFNLTREVAKKFQVSDAVVQKRLDTFFNQKRRT